MNDSALAVSSTPGVIKNHSRWSRLITLRSGLLLVSFFVLPGTLAAHAQKGSWSNLNSLRAGQRIDVTESNKKHHAGKFVSVTDAVLSLDEKGSAVSLKRQDIVRVSTPSGGRRGEQALIGLIVGAGIGAGVGAPPDQVLVFWAARRVELPLWLAS